MILKIVDRTNGEIEKTIDNVTEVCKAGPTEKEAREWIDKSSFGTPSSLYGNSGGKAGETRACTFLTVTRHSPANGGGRQEHHVFYHSKGDVCLVTIYYMNDRGVTIDRVDI